MLYVVTYFKISTFVHIFLCDNMYYKVVCIVHYRVGPRSCAPKFWFSENRTTVIPNFRGGPETVRFSQIIL